MVLRGPGISLLAPHIVVLAPASDPLGGRVQACRVARGEPWFYLRLGRAAGLTLFRVLREGLWLGECLGMTEDRADDLVETASRTLVPDLEVDGEWNAPYHGLANPGA